MYLRSDVEAKALSVWGSLENIAKEKERRKQEYDEKREVAFRLKKTIIPLIMQKGYHNIDGWLGFIIGIF